jgi:two-component system chemotaxis sensor kinase CheA
MANEFENNDAQSQEEWETYLQVFLDESDEDLESLAQALLRLEDDPHDSESLNEAFRLLHTHKSSAGLMGFEGISRLAHQLENRFDQLRSGKGTLDRARITVLLSCVDFLRSFNTGLRAGQSPDDDPSDVLRRLEDIEQQSVTADSGVDQPAASIPLSLPSIQGGYRVYVEFEEGLQLADMKARLIVARMSNVGEIIATEPPVEDTHSFDDLSRFVLIVLTDRDPSEVQQIANVDGVKSVRLEGGNALQSAGEAKELQQAGPDPASLEESPIDIAESPPLAGEAEMEPVVDLAKTMVSETIPSFGEPAPSLSPELPELQTNRAAVAETVRVDIDRLDKLMNLTGELVVTRARLVQITGELSSVFRGSGMSRRADDSSERLRLGLNKIVEFLAARAGEGNGWHELLDDLRSELHVVEEQSAAWDQTRQHFTRIAETVDQLSRVSGNLQQSVLDTRMVPVAPLFNRFRRVIRDLAGERNKQVQLVIRGEKTELDKRMIDELGDPLLHLVRNSLDHGLELPDKRRALGKPETGTIVLEAAHRGNNVFITISDDGAGLDLERIRQRVLDHGLASDTALAEMSEQQIIDNIWRPGFSTAEQVTDISGRGVGMDVVKNRIAELNGSIEVETEENAGTRFKLRLPLTLAIIRCLLVRFRGGFFSMPIDDVREIVAVEPDQLPAVPGSEMIDVRGEFIPLIRMDRIFYWHDVLYNRGRPGDGLDTVDTVNVVILHSAGRTIGLCVDELFGSADIVVKSLSDNFADIRGLSGASIMGDGTVCLMLDINEVIKMTTERSTGARPSLSI